MDAQEPVAVDTMQPPMLSIVTTLYRGRQFIEPFYKEACRVADALGLPFEIVFVNDGSPDDSLEIAHAIHKRDGRVRIVDLSRNFGHHRALMTAFAYASADLIYVTDVDLEEPMDFLRECYERFEQGDCDVVYGYQNQRRGNWLTRMTGEAFWKVFNFLCQTKLPRNLVTARLMSKRYVASLLEHPEYDPYIVGLWVSTGYNQIGLPIVKQFTGFSSYSNFRRVSLAVNSIVSFSSRPLLLSAGLGIFICLIASLCVVYLICRWLILGNEIEGWTSLTVSVWFMGGANLFFIGLVGLYVSKIFTEVKRRPNVIIKAVYGNLRRVQTDQKATSIHDETAARASKSGR
jgi:putative glycosyltransferase